MIQNLILVTTSPLAKIFQKRFQVKRKDKDGNPYIEYVTVNDLVADKERVFKEEVFSVPFRTVTGDIIFWSGVPQPIRDQEKLRALVGGSGGFEGQETDALGIVNLPIDQDVLSGMFAFVSGDTTGDIKKQIQEGLKQARIISHNRCMDAARRVYSKMMDQRRLIMEDGGKAVFRPSPTEILCTFVLENEESGKIASKRRTEIDFEESIKRIEKAGSDGFSNYESGN